MNKKTALILIEYQNDFTSEGGVFHKEVQSCMQQTNMLVNSCKVIEQARHHSIPIFHSPITFSSNYQEIRKPTYGVLQNIIDNKAFRKGTWGAEITKEITVNPEDILIEGKRGLDAFYSTNLDFILRQLDIQTVAICGFLTNCCVESTVRTAYEKGYEVITLENCCSATSLEIHENALKNNLPLFSHIMNYQQWLAQL